MRNMAWVAVFVSLTVSWTEVGAEASDYTIIDEQTESLELPFGQLLLTNTRVQEGDDTINQFTMHRLRRPFAPHRGTIVLLPSLGNSFSMYLFHESGQTIRSFAAFFARLGYEVWGYSPRETGILAGECGGALDCSEILNWNMQTIVDDVSFIRSRIELVFPGKRPAIGGLSLGAMSASAVVNDSPNAYAGLIAWEGSLISDDPAVQAHNQVFANQFGALIDAGIPVDDQSLPFVKLVAQLAQIAPNDPFGIPVPGFPPGLTNHQAFVFIMSVPNPIAPSPRNGFISAAGDFVADQLFFSDEDRLFANIAVFNDVTANGVSRDFHASLSGAETAYTYNLGNFTSPALVIKAGHGFGSIMDELGGKLGSASVVNYAWDDYAHVDLFGIPHHWLALELYIAFWLRVHVF